MNEISPFVRVHGLTHEGPGKIVTPADYNFIGPRQLNVTREFTPYTEDMLKYIPLQDTPYDTYLESLYIKIRKTGLDDIEIVARNSGLSEKEILALKKHVFLDVHDKVSLDGMTYTTTYFSAD